MSFIEEGSMGASGWQYFVPYQVDLNQALQDLRQQVFDRAEYWWYGEPEHLPSELRVPRPERLAALFEDENVQESGTHSVLDVFRVLDPDDPHDWFNYNSVYPASCEEVLRATGTHRPTRADAGTLDEPRRIR
jgi:hypothetical protein